MSAKGLRIRPLGFTLGTLALLAMLLLVPLASAVVTRLQWADDTLSTIEPRYARLLGLKAAEPQIVAAAAGVRDTVADLVYPQDQSAERVSTDLQQKLRAAATSAGFTVVGSQIQVARALSGFEEAAVSLTLEGALDHLATFADAVEQMRPLVRVSSLTMVPLRGRGVTAQRNLRAEVTLSSLRVAQ